MSVDERPGTVDPVVNELIHEVRRARRHVLERAYPLAKQLAEILELEDVELGEDAKRLRRAIGEELAHLGQDDR